MTNPNFAITFTVANTPEEVFAAIINPRAWWSGSFEGNAGTLGSEFTYRYKDIHYSKQQVAELIPNQKLVWHVVESNLSFLKIKNEWDGTDIIFEIVPKGDQTELHFTHVGLSPDIECYGACSNAWSSIINTSLREFITTGKTELGEL